MHVGVAGRNNRDVYRTAAQTIVDNHGGAGLERFADLVAAAAPGTNVAVEKVERFHLAQAIIDGRAIAIAAAGGDVAAGMAAYAARQGPWFARRQGFEDLWDGGRSFVYFAVNPGTTGATGFGPFCLVIAPGRVDNDDSAVFPFDSAQRYTDIHGTVDAALAMAQVAGWDSRSDVAITELGTQAAVTPAAQWPDLICGAHRYQEVVTVGPVDLEAVTELRLSQDKADELDALWWDLIENRLTDPVALRMAKAYNALLQWPNLQVRIV